MRIALTVLGFVCLVMVTGCGRTYHLAGHHKANLNHPPDILLFQGDRVKTISTGLVLFVLGPAHMDSSDPGVVQVDTHGRNLDKATLIAKRPGTAIVKYGWVPDETPNQGFLVTVVLGE